MIIFKELRWSDAFSYGKDNVVNFTDHQLTQILGKNGHGKSSIALILEEVLFNTNSKKIKKAKVINRYSRSKNYTIELDFDKDGNSYTISTVRTASSGTVKLVCNGVDISAHTATATYKQIEEIIGYDHKTFSQIVYQSSVSALEFLTATDTNRKKFLIELLNLSRYTKASEVFSKLASTQSKEVDKLEGSLATLQTMLEKAKKWEGVDFKELVQVPSEPKLEQDELARLSIELSEIDTTTAKIKKNNTYKDLLAGIDISPVKAESFTATEYQETKDRLAVLKSEHTISTKLSKSCTSSSSKCTSCGQIIDQAKAYEHAKLHADKLPELLSEISVLEVKIKSWDHEKTIIEAYNKRLAEWEKYSALIDKSLPNEPVSAKDLQARIEALETEIRTVRQAIRAASESNKAAEVHNAQLELMQKQLQETLEAHAECNINLAAAKEILAEYQVLVKAFSTTGLVAYKIECLVKDLEELTNEYLSDMADGRFQLSFKITSSDKLNVVITDNGEDIEIDALSSGERARVNVSTLLAIRKLMQSLSNSRTNLLILDETVENLDAEGKEKLIEVLLKEESLNTFLISHGFSHPLLEKLNVVKEHNISRIE